MALFIVATPLGNLEDITIRAIKTLFSVDTLLCEDTRRTGIFLNELGKRYGEALHIDVNTRPKLESFYDEVEWNKLPEIIEKLEHGQEIALVSDAGTPLIADPGYKLVVEAQKRNISVIPIPGPSAFITALSVSGLPTNTITLLGFLPEKEEARKKLLQTIHDHHLPQETFACYVAPHKLTKTLESLDCVYGDIIVVLARELTKIHEEVWKGTISEAQSHFKTPQGEFVLLFTIE